MESTTPCSVCGRNGKLQCSATGSTIPGSCTALRDELCNSCDDDGDGAVDEGLSGLSCTMANGCGGVSVCASGASTCAWTAGSTKACDWCGPSGRSVCGQDGSVGPCQPVSPSREVECNRCDDNKDGIPDGATGNAESCNGQDDDCDGAIDEGSSGIEGDVCQVDVVQACCEPTTCQAQGKNCGALADGCGGTLNCGTCPSGQSCGAGGVANVCACTPIPQATACNGKCGLVPNGCNGSWNCGGCAGTQTCGGGGTPNVCGCTALPQSTVCAGKNCGTVSDGCGGSYSCGGSCSGANTCGGGGTPNVCGCAVYEDACDGRECGTASNGCGGTVNCGSCSGGAYCRAGVCTGGSEPMKSEQRR
ncbi:hypothetical protein [Myxococcus sp. CA039A]|uniref:hypothetical protein n=1 Tax=Myxococcus sp. CA039A TaxID=2741737 RepID=UPI00157A92CA|nr:hypothetical protein [Myxococcus sp. CA039A]